MIEDIYTHIYIKLILKLHLWWERVIVLPRPHGLAHKPEVNAQLTPAALHKL